MTDRAYDEARARYADEYMVVLLQRRLRRRQMTGTRRKTDSRFLAKRYDSKGNRVVNR